MDAYAAGSALAGAALLAGLIATAARLSAESLFRLASLLVIADGLMGIASGRAGVPRSAGVYSVVFSHLIAACILPWRPRQAVGAMAPVLLVHTALQLAMVRQPALQQVRAILLPAFAGVPGVFAAWLRYTRSMDSLKLSFFQRRYGEVRRELVDARRIHESLFPKPIRIGPLRFRYLYEPMRQIGGDYLYACESASRSRRGHRLNLVLLDVTGHGIAAAMTVNRLHGEIERIYAEDPDANPGQVLRLLNRYVHLTLANHAVFATAFCASVDPMLDTVEYACAGHPPALVRTVDGKIVELGCTCHMLGAVADSDFEDVVSQVKFVAGDTLIAYTDGALEARRSDRRMLGLEGLRRIVASGRPLPDGGWPRTILEAVDAWREGPPTDDTLVVEVSRPVGERPSGIWAFGTSAGERYGIVVRDDGDITRRS
jgi:serine phosphatase RsbU (regulator of sigma subunit)